jgi:hypothetical protein
MQSEPSDQALIWTIDSSQWRGTEDRELDMSKIIDIRNFDIVICEITMQSEPSDQALIWAVDSIQWRGIGDRELDMSNIIDIRNPNITIYEIAI